MIFEVEPGVCGFRGGGEGTEVVAEMDEMESCAWDCDVVEVVGKWRRERHILSM